MHIKIYQINTDRDKNRVKFESLEQVEQLQQMPRIESSLYDDVFDGYVDCKDLEDVFRQFNTEGHPLHRGHSLSVSDIVEVVDDVPNLVGKIRFYNSNTAFEECTYISEEKFNAEIEHAKYVGRTIEVDDLRGKNVPSVEKGTYYCDSVGFKPVNFDTTKTQKPDNLMRVVYVEPHKSPYVAEIEDTLKGKQKAVKGFIEAVYIDDDNTCLVCNEEGKLIGMEGNRRIGNNGESIIAGPFFVCGLGDEDFRGLTDEEVMKYMERFKEPEFISEEETQADIGIVITGFNY